MAQFLISFDIDGTLDVGDPPGPLTFAVIEHALALGHIVGTASDRTLTDQSSLWARARVTPHFVSLKHELSVVRQTFVCARYLHIGDTLHDQLSAQSSGFEFIATHEAHVDRLPWLV